MKIGGVADKKQRLLVANSMKKGGRTTKLKADGEFGSPINCVLRPGCQSPKDDREQSHIHTHLNTQIEREREHNIREPECKVGASSLTKVRLEACQSPAMVSSCYFKSLISSFLIHTHVANIYDNSSI